MHHPYSPDCASVLNPCSCRYPIHMTSLSPKGNSPGCFLLTLCPSDCPLLSLADGSRSCSLFPRSTNVWPCKAPYRGALNQGQLAGCQHAIQTLAKAALAAINPFRAAKQVRDLKEYSSAWLMINSMVAKVPEALAGSVCVQAHVPMSMGKFICPKPRKPSAGAKPLSWWAVH